MYVAAGRHTVVPIMVMVVFQIPIYLGLILTWNQLKPKHSKDREELQGTAPFVQCNAAHTDESHEQPPSQVAPENKESKLWFDVEKEEAYQMYSVRLETEL